MSSPFWIKDETTSSFGWSLILYVYRDDDVFSPYCLLTYWPKLLCALFRSVSSRQIQPGFPTPPQTVGFLLGRSVYLLDTFSSLFTVSPSIQVSSHSSSDNNLVTLVSILDPTYPGPPTKTCRTYGPETDILPPMYFHDYSLSETEDKVSLAAEKLRRL